MELYKDDLNKVKNAAVLLDDYDDEEKNNKKSAKMGFSLNAEEKIKRRSECITRKYVQTKASPY